LKLQFLYKSILCSAVLMTALSVAYAQRGWGYAELPNPRKANAKAWSKIVLPLYASFVSKDLHAAKNEPPQVADIADFVGETAWRGERIGLQMLLWSGKGASDITLRVSDFENAEGQKIAAKHSSIGFVRYVMSEGYGKNGCAQHPRKGADSALVADVIDIATDVSIKKNTVQPVWFSLNIPANTPAGKYKGFVTITAKELPSPIMLTVNLLVRDRTLPPPAQWSFYLDLWQNPVAVARYHHLAPWSKAHFDIMRPLMERLAQCGQKTITIPLFDNCISSAAPDDFQSLLYATKRINGTWSLDFTKLDMWVEFMMKLGINRELCCHLSGAPTQTISFFDQASNSIKVQQLSTDSKEYAAYLNTTLSLLAAHLREKNWFSRATLCLTDIDKNHLRRLTQAVAKADSAYRVACFGASYYADLESTIYRYCVPQNAAITAKQKSQRNFDSPLCFYVPCSDAQPATYIFSPSTEAVWVGWFAAANGHSGYSRTAYCSWNASPLQDARSLQFAAGYYWLAYPGNRSSVRLERLIEGIQDYEKIRIVLHQSNDVVQRDNLLNVLKKFTLGNVTQATEIVEEAHVLLNSM
jgi:hypothetical protein